jgi:dsDNA-binding SOS-regulon protein
MSFKDEYEERSKKDFIDRKISSLGRIFDKLFFAVSKDLKNTIIVLLLMLVGYLGQDNNNLRDKIVADKVVSYDKMLDIITRQVDYKVNRQLKVETKTLEKKVDNANKKVDSTSHNLDELLNQFRKLLQKELE